MRRDEINQAVRLALAEKGYSEGWYAWKGATLRAVIDRDRMTWSELRLPSGISRKRLDERLAGLPSVGAPRKVGKVAAAKWRQLDIEDAIRMSA